MNWARQADVRSVGKKAILKELGYRAHGPDHSCQVSQRELARTTDQGERTVRRHLAELEDEGLIDRRAQPAPTGRGRWVDRYYLQVPDPAPVEAQPNYTPPAPVDQPASGADQPANGDDQPASGGRWIEDPEPREQLPPLVPPLARQRWAPIPQTLDALPAARPPESCDDRERARGHPECHRVAGLVIGAASRRAELPLTATERRKLRSFAAECVQAGYAPEALASAIASAPARTPGAVMFQMRKRSGPRSVGADTVDVARSWIAKGGRL